MGIRSKHGKLDSIFIAFAAFFLFMLGTISSAQAVEYPAATFKPFAGQQTKAITGPAQDRWIYPFDSNYLLISYGKNADSTDQDIIIDKLDKDGKAVWKQVYNLSGADTLSLIHFQENAFVIAINSQQNNTGINRILQLDSNGRIVWQREVPLNTVDSIGSTNDEGFIIAGTIGTSDKDIRIIKMDKNGDWVDQQKNASKWIKTYANAGNQKASEINQLLDEDEYNNGYFVTGYTDSNTNGKKDVYLMRLDAYGTIKWNKNYGTAYNDEGISAVAGVDEDENILGFLVAGNTETRTGDQNIYFFYVDKYGYIQKHPGYQTHADALIDRQFGASGDQTSIALVAVPEGFIEDRKLRGKEVEGYGGGVLVGYSAPEKEVLLTRINEYGHVIWQRELPVPGDDLIIGTIVKGDDDTIQDLIYSISYTNAAQQNLDIYTLQVYLSGVLEDDKTIPQNDQLESNQEAVRWEKKNLKYEALRDISKEIKDLMKLQPVVPLTAVSTSRGELEWPDTSYYLGNLVIGKADGEGTLLFPNGVWYKGAWKNNMFNGKGYLRFPTGESYEGEFKDHMMHGQGIFRWPTGESYSGEFRYCMRDGKGVFSWPGGVVYEGEFAADEADGDGIIRWPSGERYEGQMLKGEATGQGKYFFPNGEWYSGEFKGLSFEGVGVYHWPNGAYYVGEFKNDRLYGEGYYIWPNGVQQWGYWKNDRYLGIHKEMLDSDVEFTKD